MAAVSIPDGIRFLLCSFVEMGGNPKAKLVPITHLDDLVENGAGFAGFAAGEMGQGPHSPDLAVLPDLQGLTPLPWRKEIAWVPGNVFVEGEAYDFCPRTILQRQLARAAESGWSFKTGVEPEFFLLKAAEKGGCALLDDLDTLPKPCYDLGALHRNLDLITAIVTGLQELGWQPYATDHEDGNCQFEINWTFAEALTTADRHVFFRFLVKAMAEQFGCRATFMPKPFTGKTGNGCHFHQSLWDAASGQNLFADSGDANGLSEMAYHYMGGIMAHARAIAAVTNPLVNSYKRLKTAPPSSGATWAPVYVTYGGSNRTQMIRIPGPGRIENRAADGAANPYLAAAVQLAAGLDGIARGLCPGARNDENLYTVSEAELLARGIGRLPRHLGEAVDALEADPVICAALGERYAENYIAVKRAEWWRYHESVSDWEIENYLGVY